MSIPQNVKMEENGCFAAIVEQNYRKMRSFEENVVQKWEIFLIRGRKKFLLNKGKRIKTKNQKKGIRRMIQ